MVGICFIRILNELIYFIFKIKDVRIVLKGEIKEEIGVNLNDDFNLLDTQLRKQQFIDIYTTNQIIKKVTLQKEEVSDYKFVTKDEFNKMINDNEIVPAIIDRYNMIKNRVLW